MGLLRSETMKHGTLVLPNDSAREFIDILGRAPYIQFVDMNENSMMRPYRKYIQRVDEMERILRFLFEEIEKLPGAVVTKNAVENFLTNDSTYQLDRVEETLNKLYVQFVRFRENNGDLVAQRVTAVEEYNVLLAATTQLSKETGVEKVLDRTTTEDPVTLALLNGHGVEEETVKNSNRYDDTSMTFSNMAGVIATADQERFSRFLFRATRGNTYTQFQTINPEKDEATGVHFPSKSVFVVYFQGSSTSALHEKITKICVAFGVSCYKWPQSHEEASRRLNETAETIKDKEKGLSAYTEYFLAEITVLLEIVRGGGCSLIEEWRLFCLKEKEIYMTLNMFEGTDITLRANCWFPEEREEEIREILMAEGQHVQASAFLLSDKTLGRKNPPTYIRTTKFSKVFQTLVDTYGAPRYQEVNPALFSIVSFPFLFGVMYGDIGHGSCVLLFGLYVVINFSKLQYANNEVLQMLLSARYMIILMGFFATYAGFIYNDFFSIGLDIFGSKFTEESRDHSYIYYKMSQEDPYPFGFDPKWKGATNELAIMNSFKMKFSVLVAFVQMGGGVILKALNTIHFRQPLEFIFEFLPQIVFLSSLVGYMDLLILMKWLQKDGNNPKIISTIIDMFMFTPLKAEDALYAGQATVQTVLVILMALAVPLMLLPKPFIRFWQHKQSSKQSLLDRAENSAEDTHEEFDFGEEFIHQIIETIEFVLGTISNTASYLRLWALSLAHQQLALVFFSKSVLLGLEWSENVAVTTLLVFTSSAIFATITFGVMLCLDSLECFLHALRLQWVEFQNKFYKADGYKFVPLCFKETLLEIDKD